MKAVKRLNMHCSFLYLLNVFATPEIYSWKKYIYRISVFSFQKITCLFTDYVKAQNEDWGYGEENVGWEISSVVRKRQGTCSLWAKDHACCWTCQVTQRTSAKDKLRSKNFSFEQQMLLSRPRAIFKYHGFLIHHNTSNFGPEYICRKTGLSKRSLADRKQREIQENQLHPLGSYSCCWKSPVLTSGGHNTKDTGHLSEDTEGNVTNDNSSQATKLAFVHGMFLPVQALALCLLSGCNCLTSVQL